MLVVRPIDTVRVVDIERGRAQALADEASAAHSSLSVEVRSSVRDAIAGADVIVTATTSPTPILEWDWIAPGSHVNAVGSHSPGVRELATNVVVRSRIVVDSREAALKEAGDFLIPIREGALTPEAIEAELGQVVAGLRPARRDRSEVTLYKSCGIALQDVATARLVYSRALERGIGRTVEL
jgi:ornithine cyclodeaminase/alanine dehydrogenase-like protein (mu-crystallin family)